MGSKPMIRLRGINLPDTTGTCPKDTKVGDANHANNQYDVMHP